jgi:hypothetical protein
LIKLSILLIYPLLLTKKKLQKFGASQSVLRAGRPGFYLRYR